MAGIRVGAEVEPIPISALQHAAYCLRQAALIHLERLWAENRFTAGAGCCTPTRAASGADAGHAG